MGVPTPGYNHTNVYMCVLFSTVTTRLNAVNVIKTTINTNNNNINNQFIDEWEAPHLILSLRARFVIFF